MQRAAAARGQGRGARARRAHPHPRRRQPHRVPAHHGGVPQDAGAVPRRHRLPRRPDAHRPRRLHHRASLDALSVRRRRRASLAETGATVGHCPYKYAKMAIDAPLLPALPRRRGAAWPWAPTRSRWTWWPSCAGRRCSPRSPTRTTRRASPATSSTRRRSARASSCGATTSAAWRPGAKADILLINLDHLGAAFYADPIKALVDAGMRPRRRHRDRGRQDAGRGRPRGAGGRGRGLRKAREATHHYWRQRLRAGGADGDSVDRIIPPAFRSTRPGDSGPRGRRHAMGVPAPKRGRLRAALTATRRWDRAQLGER